MKMLITGGAGFIGSNFIRHIMARYPEYKIINLDYLTYAGNLENLRDVEKKKNYQFIRGNVCDVNVVEAVVSGNNSQPVDVIVNFAAESHVDRSISSPGVFIETNIWGTQVLLDAARKHGVKKYVQISTDEVYGSLGPNGLFTEETPLAPNSPYSASKAGADLLTRAYYQTYGLPVNISRCSNNYGPYQFPEKLIPLLITNAMQGKELPIYGDGRYVRDWLHVLDHCEAIDLIVHRGEPGEIYNIGGSQERQNIDMAKMVLSLLNLPESMIRHVTDRPGHDRRYAIDTSKIRRKLGWKPAYTFVEGIRQTVEWYIRNQKWWERIKSREYQEYYPEKYERP